MLRYLFSAIMLMGYTTLWAQVDTKNEGVEISQIEEEIPKKFIDFFPEIDPTAMRFEPLYSMETSTLEVLDENALSEIAMIPPYEGAKFYAIGRSEFGKTTLFFLYYPHPYGWFDVMIFACDETGEFAATFHLATAMQDGGEDTRTMGWMQDLDNDGLPEFITRTNARFTEPDSDDEETNIMHPCEVYNYVNGSFEQMEYSKIDELNKKYRFD